MNIRLPSWPMESVIRAACAEWTILHPDNPADPMASPWDLVVMAVDCWGRHRCSDYDLQYTDEARASMHQEIRRAARRQYKWLRSLSDPRIAVASTESQPLVLNDISHGLNDIVEQRALLLQKRRLTRDPDERRKIDADLAVLDRQSAVGMRLCQNARDREVTALAPLLARSSTPISGSKSLKTKCSEPRSLLSTDNILSRNQKRKENTEYERTNN